ncbi:MAG TPA: FliG C-terminal domain-containing protein [Mycobacteriales bacterium]|nr:FliG C-terminal domain-containing protein [Mycobacteriales bacterium]
MTVAAASRPGSNRRKAAVALVALGEERATAVLRGLDRATVRELVAEIARLGPVRTDEVRAALDELSAGLGSDAHLPAPSSQFAESLLRGALGDAEAEAAADLHAPRPFSWLAETDPVLATAILSMQPASVVAVALAHLQPHEAAPLLRRLPPEIAAGVVVRLAGLRALHPSAVHEVETSLRQEFAAATIDAAERVPGPVVLADILSHTGGDSRSALLASLSAADPDLAESVRAALFTFTDLADLPPRTLQQIVAACDARDLAKALWQAPQPVVDTVLANMSERAREALSEEQELFGTQPPAAKDVTESRRAVVSVARRLEDEGAIQLTRDDAS